MKKDKKWFVDKWTKERDKTSIHEPMYYFINDFITDVKELDELEVLSQKWIDEHATAVTYDEILDQTEIVYVDDLENLIIPKEESEVTLNSAFEKISEIYPITKEEVCRHLEKVTAYGGKVTYGEPEVLSQEWIDSNSIYASSDGVTEEYVHVSDLENLLVPNISEMETVDITEGQIMDWLDDNDFFHHATAETVLANAVDKGELGYYGTKYSVIEKPVIPKFVAEWIETHLEQGFDLYPALKKIEDNSRLWTKGYNWYRENTLDFTIAYLTKEYKLEEEPLYYALIKGHELVNDEGEWSTKYWNLWVSGGSVFPADRLAGYDDFLTTMSKEEWSEWGINDTNADFVKVGENE